MLPSDFLSKCAHLYLQDSLRQRFGAALYWYSALVVQADHVVLSCIDLARPCVSLDSYGDDSDRTLTPSRLHITSLPNLTPRPSRPSLTPIHLPNTQFSSQRTHTVSPFRSWPMPSPGMSISPIRLNSTLYETTHDHSMQDGDFFPSPLSSPSRSSTRSSPPSSPLLPSSPASSPFPAALHRSVSPPISEPSPKNGTVLARTTLPLTRPTEYLRRRCPLCFGGQRWSHKG